ncbi:MAG: hypothetical protein L0H63_12620, partial [Nitrococcus sp.]|nr:hypothetical protein [Nitrococcus sp.]
MHYGYDSLGRLASITWPVAVEGHDLEVLYAWDASGDLASVTNAHTGTVYWQLAGVADEVSAWGAAQRWTLGNGVTVRRLLDPATGRVTSITAGPNYSALRVSLAYARDARGNVTEAFDILTGVGYKSATTHYDALDRLHEFRVHNDAGGHGFTANYTAGGNLHWRSGAGHYYYNASQPHAVSKIEGYGETSHYHYNGVGEMTSGPSLGQIDWTRGGRVKQLVGATTTSLAYGANGHLVQKSVAGTTSRYVGRLLVKIGDSWRARIVANGEVIAIVKINAAGVPTTDYLVNDAQGSPAALLNESGGLIARFAWNAWGELVDPADGTGPDPNADQKHALTTLGYTGHEMLWEAGLVHTYARLYNAHIGRWLSPDPTVPRPFNGQGLNRYS